MNGSSQRQVAFAVEAQKIRSYLLNVHHPTGGSKARFFIGWGFRVDDPSIFAASLIDHARPDHHVRTTTSQWGTKHIFEGHMRAPNGITPRVRSIWNVKPGTNVAVLSTAYPF